MHTQSRECLDSIELMSPILTGANSGSSHKYNKQEWQTYKNNDEHKYVCDDIFQIYE